MLLNQEYEFKDYWIAQNKIPLGTNLYDNSYVFKIMPKMSDSLVMSAIPGVGKTNLFTLIYYFMSKTRPVVVFDWEGEDHKLSHFANSAPICLPPHSYPSGIKKAFYFSYPSILRFTSAEHEVTVVPDLTDFSSDELRGLGFPLGASMELKRILKSYGPFKDLVELYEFVRGFPTNERESKSHHKNEKNPVYNLNDTIPSQTKQSLQKYLFDIMEKKLFSIGSGNEPLIEDLLSKGYSVFFNFNGNVDLARVVISRMLDNIVDYRKRNPELPAPGIFFEEADRIMPRNLDDREEKKKTEYVLTRIVESYNRARKLRIGLYANTPALSNLHRRIIDNSYEKIFGRLSGFDLAEVKRCTSESVFLKVLALRYNRYKNIREFCYYNEFRNIFVFQPWESPCEHHREMPT